MIDEFILRNRWLALNMFDAERMSIALLVRLFSVTRVMRAAWCKVKDPFWIAVYKRRANGICPPSIMHWQLGMPITHAFIRAHYDVLLDMEVQAGWVENFCLRAFYEVDAEIRALLRQMKSSQIITCEETAFEWPAQPYTHIVVPAFPLPTPSPPPVSLPTTKPTLRSICRQTRKARNKEFRGLR